MHQRSTRESTATPVCYNLEDEQDVAAAWEYDDSVQHATRHCACMHSVNVCPFVDNHPLTHEHSLGEILPHDDIQLIEEDSVNAENLLDVDVLITAAQAQASSTSIAATGHGLASKGNAKAIENMEETGNELECRLPGRRLSDDRNGSEGSHCRLEKDHAEDMDCCGPSSTAAGACHAACAGAAGGLNSAESNKDTEQGFGNANAGDEIRATCSDKTVRFQDSAEVHRLEDLLARASQAEGEPSCEMLELLQLSCSLAKRKRRDGDRRLMMMRRPVADCY
eukprot:3772849-Amphidinium_carterae.4